MKKLIEWGHTNKSYKMDNIFYQEKNFTGFNHKIDYSVLKNINFVPKLIKNNNDDISWEFIEGEEPELSDKDLKLIAKQLFWLHQQEIKFPPSNHAARIKKYRQDLKDRNRNIPIVNEYYRRINNILSKSNKDIPLHNDLWPKNLIKKDDKIFFVDWEYATLGDKHFDLAYFICSSNLNENQEKIFLEQYADYYEDYLLQQKILVNYLIILWVNSHECKPFDEKPYVEAIYKIDKIYQYKKENNLF